MDGGGRDRGSEGANVRAIDKDEKIRIFHAGPPIRRFKSNFGVSGHERKLR
jgi:hypothetical protein